jgi:hypothetical protein
MVARDERRRILQAGGHIVPGDSKIRSYRIMYSSHMCTRSVQASRSYGAGSAHVVARRPSPRTFVNVAVALLCLGVASAACGPDEPLKVSTIQTGRSLNPDNSVAAHTTTFKPDDTIYVSVLTTDAGSGTIGARWTFGSRLISEPKQEVSYKGPAATEFHIQNSGGFPQRCGRRQASIPRRTVEAPHPPAFADIDGIATATIQER